MRHRNAGAYALVGSLALACGFTMGFVASNSEGPDDGGLANLVKAKTPFDPAYESDACDYRERREDGFEEIGSSDESPQEMTIRIVVSDGRGGTGDEVEVLSESCNRLSDAVNEASMAITDAIGEMRAEGADAPSAGFDEAVLTVEQCDALRRALAKRMGDDVAISKISYEDWDGGDGRRLDVTGYANPAEFKSGDELAKAFGKAMADLAGTVDGELGDVDLLSVKVLGIDGRHGADMPPEDKAEWVVAANVDLPSSDGKSLGDVNRASVIYHQEPVDIDLGKCGFSALPPEE